VAGNFSKNLSENMEPDGPWSWIGIIE
jgi:hypothetical protein